MTKTIFAPKDADVLRRETIEGYGFDENDETHKPIIEKIVADRLKDEQLKASFHEDKNKHLKGKNFYKEVMVKAGLDPKTGEKISSNEGENKDKKVEYVTKADLDKLQHRQKYAYLTDEEYDLVNSKADKYGGFEKAMQEDKICSGYFKASDIKSRIENVNLSPSTRIAPDKTGAITDEQREFAIKCGNDPDKVYAN